MSDTISADWMEAPEVGASIQSVVERVGKDVLNFNRCQKERREEPKQKEVKLQ